MAGGESAHFDQVDLRPEDGRHGDPRKVEPGTHPGIVETRAPDRSVAGADVAPLCRDREKGLQRRHMFRPDAVFGVIALVRLENQTPASGVIFRLVAGSPFATELAFCPGAPGGRQFPRLALAIASV